MAERRGEYDGGGGVQLGPYQQPLPGGEVGGGDVHDQPTCQPIPRVPQPTGAC